MVTRPVEQAGRRAARRRRRRSCPRVRRLPDRRASEEDRRRRHPRRRVDGSDRRRRARRATPSSPRSSCRSSRASRWAPAIRATAAPTRTRSPGAARRRRCRWRTIRASCSSGCSAAATAPIRRPGARGAQEDRSILDAVTARRRAVCALELGSPDRAKLDQYLEAIRDLERRIPEDEAAERARAAGARSAGRHSRRLRRAREADVRPAGARVPGRPDARDHVHGRARDQPARLSRRSACPTRTTRCRITAATARRSSG